MSSLTIIPSELKSKWDAAVALYEKKRAAMLPVLRLSQEHFGYISEEVERAIAEYMETTPIHVREVVSFYSLFVTKPIGKYHIQLCRTLSCSLTGFDSIKDYLQKKLGIQDGQTTPDGKFTLTTAECLGACEIAPMMQINKDIYGPLTPEKVDEILDGLT